MTLRLLTEQHLEFLCLKGGFTGSSESTFVKMSHCWKSHVMAQIYSKTGGSRPEKRDPEFSAPLAGFLL